MNFIEESVKKIDILMDNIKNDAKRSKLLDLLDEIKYLSSVLWESERDYDGRKSKRDFFYITNKASNRSYLESVEKAAAIEEKRKPRKITNVEVEDMTDLQYVNPQEWEEPIRKKLLESKQIVDYLKPLLDSYTHWINWVKFLDRSN